ncbi:hypothetical protein [Hoeflea alexandrii]|jgi:hypothetical protein|uniref:hypothetical protein n=1 Tax=Hoeflea alexandrii TaxID=288436 RepID=UPI00125AE72F|nr:hypothetical protein HOE425_330496 [Hoeflea sp. EC-HK425]
MAAALVRPQKLFAAQSPERPDNTRYRSPHPEPTANPPCINLIYLKYFYIDTWVANDIFGNRGAQIS